MIYHINNFDGKGSKKGALIGFENQKLLDYGIDPFGEKSSSGLMTPSFFFPRFGKLFAIRQSSC